MEASLLLLAVKRCLDYHLARLTVIISESQDAHRSVAMRACKHRSWPWRARPDNDMQDKLNQQANLFRVPMEKAIVAHPPESAGQDMFQQKIHKFFPFKCFFLRSRPCRAYTRCLTRHREHHNQVPLACTVQGAGQHRD